VYVCVCVCVCVCVSGRETLYNIMSLFFVDQVTKKIYVSFMKVGFID